MNKIKNGCYILLLISALLVIFLSIPSSEQQLWKDFYHFYVAAKALLSGASLYAGDHRTYIYPPLFAFLLTPLAHLSYPLAHAIWIGLCFLFLVIISVLGLRIIETGFQIKCTPWQAIGACSLSVLLMRNQMYFEFSEGQDDLLILLGFTFALYWLQRRPRLAGIALGLIADIKYQAFVMLPLLLFRNRLRAIVGLFLGILLGALIPAILIGWHLNLEYLQIAVRGLTNMGAPVQSADVTVSYVPSIIRDSNCSVTSGLARIFYYYGGGIRNGLICALILFASVLLFIRNHFQKQGIAFIWRKPFANIQQETATLFLEWQIVIVGMLVFSPECYRRHLILAYPLNLLAVLLFFSPKPQLARGWPILLAIAFSQLAEIHIHFTHFINSDLLSFPGIGYFFFLLIMIPNVLKRYRELYGAHTEMSVPFGLPT